VDVTSYRASASVTVEAEPQRIYDLVSDISRMGEWSPVSTGGTYDPDRTWFTGTNAIGEITWETRCKVVESDPGRAFVFENHGQKGRHPMVRWAFSLRPAATGTEVTESWQVLPGYVDAFAEEEEPRMTLEERLDVMRSMAEQGMPETLAGLKQAAEGPDEVSAGRTR
jgi:hypothetical protein